MDMSFSGLLTYFEDIVLNYPHLVKVTINEKGKESDLDIEELNRRKRKQPKKSLNKKIAGLPSDLTA